MEEFGLLTSVSLLEDFLHLIQRKCQGNTCRQDENVDDCLHHCDGDLVKLWTVLKDEGYAGLSNIAFGIMAMPPENASCERAFLIMKYTCLTQLHLDNTLRIAMDTRTPTEFPYDRIV